MTRSMPSSQDDSLPLSQRQQDRLAAARQRAMQQFEQRHEQPAALAEKVSLWVLRHTVLVRRSTVALSLALLTGMGFWLSESLLLEESVDTRVLSQELPLDAFLDPQFSDGLRE